MQNWMHSCCALIPLSLLGDCFHLVTTPSVGRILFCPSPRAVQDWWHSGSSLVLFVTQIAFSSSVLFWLNGSYIWGAPASGDQVSVNIQIFPTTLLCYFGLCFYLPSHRITESSRLEGTSGDCIIHTPAQNTVGHLEQATQNCVQLGFEYPPKTETTSLDRLFACSVTSLKKVFSYV